MLHLSPWHHPLTCCPLAQLFPEGGARDPSARTLSQFSSSRGGGSSSTTSSRSQPTKALCIRSSLSDTARPWCLLYLRVLFFSLFLSFLRNQIRFSCFNFPRSFVSADGRRGFVYTGGTGAATPGNERGCSYFQPGTLDIIPAREDATFGLLWLTLCDWENTTNSTEIHDLLLSSMSLLLSR